MSGPEPDPAVDADVAALLRKVGWPDHTPLQPFGSGSDHQLWQTRSGSQALLVKTATHGQPRFASAAWASRTLRAAGIPTATVVGWTDRILVEQRCPGRPLAADGSIQPADLTTAAAAGQLLQRIHRIPVAGFGRLDGTGTGPVPSLTAWLLDARPPAADIGNHTDLRLIADARTALTRHQRLLPRPFTARLVHGDWVARHVITARPGAISGLVDLASVRGGHPLTDLAAWSLQEPSALTAALFDGYFTGPPSRRPAALLTLLRLRIGAALLSFHRGRPGDGNLAEKYRRQLTRDIAALDAGIPRAIPDCRAPAAPPRPSRPDTGDDQ